MNIKKSIFISIKLLTVVTILTAIILTIATKQSLKPIPKDLSTLTNTTNKPQLKDRHNQPLTVTYQNQWNAHHTKQLHDIPEFLQSAFLLAEDKRYYQHKGIDWSARLQALVQNITAMKSVRGASTISEQVVRMINPRPRTLWSRWVEGWESSRLENIHDKETILEFYLNQVPYAAQRRGVVQAAKYYFDRDLNTLSQKEMMALAILVRAPSRLDLHKNTHSIDKRLERLAQRAIEENLIDEPTKQTILEQKMIVRKPMDMLDIKHFSSHVYKHTAKNTNVIKTTLDSNIQRYAQKILDQRLQHLQSKNVNNAGMIIIDHHSNDILAWVVGQPNKNKTTDLGYAYDTVLTKRQPGSTLKPFVYAAAFEKGWTPATLISDSPLKESVGQGLHSYRNYSNTYYGNVSARDALGNSLNIPAIRTAQYIGLQPLLATFRKVGIKDFNLRAVDYGHGIALGNAETSLYSLAQAYAVLARKGSYQPLNVSINATQNNAQKSQAFSPEVSSLISNILSDPNARDLEFSANGTLALPVQTAVKTGTSTGYRDAWTVGYNYRYVVAVWMGNVDNQPMLDITGSKGPAPVLRSMFAELNRNQQTQPLYLSRKLISKNVCINTGELSNDTCTTRQEWFLPSNIPSATKQQQATAANYTISQPTDQLHLALDPRVPDKDEAFKFMLNQKDNIEKVEWVLNDELIKTTKKAEYLWSLEQGKHTLSANIFIEGQGEAIVSERITFIVK